MSTVPDNEFDLEKLFLPAWAQEPSSAKYAKYEGETVSDRREGRRGPRPPRRDGPRDRRDQPRRDRPDAPRGRGGPNRPDRPDRRGRPSDAERSGPRQEGWRERRPPPPPLPEVNVSLVPDEKGVESLARQIKMTGRAYPLFDIAQMILQKPERHTVVFSVKKNAEGQVIQPLFVCALDDTLWLSQDEAVAHVLKKHFATFYQAERTATEPPKGKYTFVAQCGLSGTILGPPNYHDYQNQLHKLHSERFSRMPFDVYKSRVKIVRDEEVVKKWIDDQSWRTEYTCLNLPEPLRLGNMEAVEKHFRETHVENIIKPVESHTLTGTTARALRSPELVRTVRSVWEDQRRFPLQIATVLSQQFAGHGLQFFKVNKTITHVSVARPHYLDVDATPISEGVKRIVDYINAHPKCSRRNLVESLAPSPGGAESPKGTPAAPTPLDPNQPTAEQTAVIADLHWLIHQGHVIEFANGMLDTAKKPVPKPAKPAPKPSEAAAEGIEPAVPSEGQTPSASAETISAPEAQPTPEVGESSPAQDPPQTTPEQVKSVDETRQAAPGAEQDSANQAQANASESQPNEERPPRKELPADPAPAAVESPS